MLRVTSVAVGDGYVLHLTFSDGTAGKVDLARELWGEMFAPLTDPEVFRLVGVDDELGTVVWPNSADLDPEGLYEAAVRGAPARI